MSILSKLKMQDQLPLSSLTKIQVGSGAVFATFTIVHLLNTISRTMGHLIYDEFQEWLRGIYQYPVIEITLASSLLIHISASMIKTQRKYGNIRLWLNSFTPSIRSLHRITGWILTAMIMNHIGNTRGFSLSPANVIFRPSSSYIGFSVKWWPYLFYPYYIILGTAGMIHTAIGLLYLPHLNDKPTSLPPLITTYATTKGRTKTRINMMGYGLMAGVLVVGVSVFSFGGVGLGDVALAKDDAVYARHFEHILPRVFLPWR
eukprot:TRINITY_DN7145_c0_g1_i1.p1 TRINITY_DN7145_c0_g1~~TRINITY_DN7145_c0_g1_i1.p1  ORF type:complete len:260 (+),score=37.82 TRINITY_DN7145_c0_g1_i1:98-877(+)